MKLIFSCFSTTALSTTRFISYSAAKVNRSPIANLKFWKLGNITWGISSDIPQSYLGDIQSRDAFRPIACQRKYLMDYNHQYIFSRLVVITKP